MHNKIVVDKFGSGQFDNINDALKYIQLNHIANPKIYLKNGKYSEVVEIKIHNLIIIGEDIDNTIISFNHYAQEFMEDIGKRGTFRTYTCLIDANNIKISNITIENTSGYGNDIKQAIALYVDGNEIKIDNCKLLGHQDTLFTGPLPPFEIEKNGFIGPKQNAPRMVGTQYYKNCLIRGDIDFIFGSAIALFENCELFSHNINEQINGYVCAPSTNEDQPYGYVFKNCNFTSDCPANSVYLGRPWRDHAKAVLINCKYGAHIKEIGWDDWNKKATHATVYFGEYNEFNISGRADYVHILAKSDLSNYENELILKGKWFLK